MATEKFRMDAINVWTAQEKFQMDNASRSNSEQKILNEWCQPFKRLTKNFVQMMPVIQTADNKSPTDDASRSNAWQKISNLWCQPFEQPKK